MARRAVRPFRIYPSRGWAYIDADIAGERVREALGVAYSESSSRSESRAAHEAAARRYAELIAGRTVKEHTRVLTAARLEELLAMYLDAIETPSNRKSIKTKRGYHRTFVRWSSDAERWAKDSRTPLERLVSDEGPTDFAMHRLGLVLRKTVRKELTDLFAFLRWSKLRGYLASLPPRPVLPQGEPGVRAGKQRSRPVHITPVEARAIVAALPVWSTGRRPRGRATKVPLDRFRVRAVFEFMWETGLRPSTIARLAVGRNWVRGSRELEIHDADDKARYGRVLTLTKRAAEILEVCAGETGLVFGEHDHRVYLRSAALMVLPKEKAAKFARYDFRHGRARAWLRSTGNLLGVGYQLGHKQVTTTNAYLEAQRSDGDDVIAVDENISGGVSILSADAAATPDSSRGEWIRTTDPQTPSAPGNETSSGDSAIAPTSGDVKNPDEPPPPNRDSSAFRQPQALVEAARGLAIQRAIWDAFDAVSYGTEDES